MKSVFVKGKRFNDVSVSVISRKGFEYHVYLLGIQHVCFDAKNESVWSDRLGEAENLMLSWMLLRLPMTEDQTHTQINIVSNVVCLLVLCYMQFVCITYD